MKTLGITGGIGSGKTAACRHFDALGTRVVYADLVARELMETDADLVTRLREAFGEATYTPDGRLNRPHLAARVFGDADALERLNALVHPRVRDAFFRLRDEAAAAGAPLFVYEAALIYESGADQFLDAVAVVDAPVETRIARVVARDGTTREQVRARMAHQLDPADLRARADYVIENDGDEAHLHRQVERVFRAMTTENAVGG
jgi:dephospho-CoA kinase